MRLVRFTADGCCGYGVYTDDGVQVMSWEPFDYLVDTVEVMPLESVKLLSPVVPTKIVAIGLNYSDHAAEFDQELPDEPLLFMKASSTVLAPDGEVVYPPQSKRLDFEAELAVVIGAEAHQVSVEEADSYVLGYTCGLDMTARDLQSKDGQWTRSKNFDTFCPLGPWVDTDVDPTDLAIKLSVNGETRQDSRTSQMIFGVPHLVSFISGVMTLYPGDVIMTGTPPGVGPVEVGDRIEMSIEGVGTLACTIAAP